MKLFSSPYMLAVISIVYMIGTSIQQSYFPSAEPPAVAVTVEEPPVYATPASAAPSRQSVILTRRMQPEPTVSLVNFQITVPQSAVRNEQVVEPVSEPGDSNLIIADLEMNQDEYFLGYEAIETTFK